MSVVRGLLWTGGLGPSHRHDAQKTCLCVVSMRDEYARQGVTADHKVIVYCNTGTEASHIYFALKDLLGFKHVTVYVPSYTDWAARLELPVETGAGQP